MSVLSKEISVNEANVINALDAMSPEEAKHFGKLIRHDSKYKRLLDIFNGYKKAPVKPE